mmetsp:Transcript_44861/g.124409  ORF Transcript_44861/g.124409 Transcript_44861/m.124409 type:complete len:293 (-) Transcript_44861:103-981(-)
MCACTPRERLSRRLAGLARKSGAAARAAPSEELRRAPAQPPWSSYCSPHRTTPPPGGQRPLQQPARASPAPPASAHHTPRRSATRHTHRWTAGRTRCIPANRHVAFKCGKASGDEAWRGEALQGSSTAWARGPKAAWPSGRDRSGRGLGRGAQPDPSSCSSCSKRVTMCCSCSRASSRLSTAVSRDGRAGLPKSWPSASSSASIRIKVSARSASSREEEASCSCSRYATTFLAEAAERPSSPVDEPASLGVCAIFVATARISSLSLRSVSPAGASCFCRNRKARIEQAEALL